MAAVQRCDQHDTSEAVVIIHSLATADFAGLCLPCLLDYAQAALQQFAPDRLAAAEKPPPRRKRTAAAAAVADDSQAGESDESRAVAGTGAAAG